MRVHPASLYRSAMERTGHTGWTGKGVSCPLCGHTDVHYRKETDTRVRGHWEYRWYTLEHHTMQRPPGTSAILPGESRYTRGPERQPGGTGL